MLARKWLLLFVLPLLAGTALACGGSSKNGGSDQGIKIEQTAGGGVSTTPGAPPATLSAAPTIAGPLASADEIANLASNFGKAKSFKATISQSGGPAALDGTIEYQTPDKIRVSIKNGALNQQIICLGDAYFFKVNADAWQKAPPNSPNCRVNLGPADPTILGESLKKATEDKSLSKGSQESVAGKRCQIYLQALPNGSSFEMCVADNLPLRIISKDTRQTMTILFSDYDKPIDIKSPL
jgi:hypothetical protein